MWEIKREPKRANRDRNKFKIEPTRPKWNPKGTKRVPTDAKVAPKSCLGALEVLGLFTFFMCKNRHDALVGLTLVKGTSVDKLFNACILLGLNRFRLI